LSGRRNRASVYDLSRFEEPVLVGERQIEMEPHALIESTAISPDGSLIALLVLRQQSERAPFSDVLLLDRRLERSLLLVENTLARGLHFEGKWLFVGFAPGEDSFAGAMNPTTSVSVFDADEIRAALR
jgi:hypothetical protein